MHDQYLQMKTNITTLFMSKFGAHTHRTWQILFYLNDMNRIEPINIVLMNNLVGNQVTSLHLFFEDE